MDTFRSYSILLLAALLSACSATRVIKPLEKGEHQISASLGGPSIIFFGAPIPTPLSSISYQNGLDTGVTFSGGIHTTSALFGVLQSDIGLAIEVARSKNERFGLVGTPTINTLFDFHENNLRLYPQLEFTGWWQYSEKPHLLYVGVGSWIELERVKAHMEVQSNEFMPYITLGHQLNTGTWGFQIEARYIGMQHDTDPLVVDYISPFHKGVIGVYLGFSKTFGK